MTNDASLMGLYRVWTGYISVSTPPISPESIDDMFQGGQLLSRPLDNHFGLGWGSRLGFVWAKLWGM